MNNYTPEQREWLGRRKMKTTGVMLISFIFYAGSGAPSDSLIDHILSITFAVIFYGSLIYLLMLNTQ